MSKLIIQLCAVLNDGIRKRKTSSIAESSTLVIEILKKLSTKGYINYFRLLENRKVEIFFRFGGPSEISVLKGVVLISKPGKENSLKIKDFKNYALSFMDILVTTNCGIKFRNELHDLKLGGIVLVGIL
jgi:ribosomal protein S8